MRETLISSTHKSPLNLSRLEAVAWCIVIAFFGVAGLVFSLKIGSWSGKNTIQSESDCEERLDPPYLMSMNRPVLSEGRCAGRRPIESPRLRGAH